MREYKKDDRGSVGYVDGPYFHYQSHMRSPIPTTLIDATAEEVAEFEAKEAKWNARQERIHKHEAELLALCGLTHGNFCRFRGVSKEDGKLYVSTRENGVNSRSVDAIRNANYESSCSDDFDSTYETYVFTIPAEP